MATLLQNVQAVCGELGLPVPSTLAASSSQLNSQIIAVMNGVLLDLLREKAWTALSKESRFVTVNYTYTGDVTAGSNMISNLSSTAGLSTDFMPSAQGLNVDTFITSVTSSSVMINIPASETAVSQPIVFSQAIYPMPFDFDRITASTAYNKSTRWEILGPKNAQDWQWLKSGYINSGPRARWRQIGGKFVVWPPPPADQEFGFEYQSKNAVQAADGQTKDQFTTDTDVSLIYDRLVVVATKLRLWEIKGFGSASLADQYRSTLDQFKAQDGGAEVLTFTSLSESNLLTQNNIPDVGYGQ